MNTNSTTFIPDMMEWETFAMIPRREEGQQDDLFGRPGRYDLDIVLLAPGRSYFEDILNVTMDPRGDSYILLLEGMTGFQVISPQGPNYVRVVANEHGRLAKLQCTVSADSREAAEIQGLNLVATTLSHISHYADVPIELRAIRVTEVATGSVWVRMLVPSGIKPWPTTNKVVARTMRPIYALYREGVSTANPFYQFLCFYKVMEGIRKLRSGLHKDIALQKGTSLSRPKETLNGLGEEQLPTWKALRGKSFSDVFDYLSQNERVSVAHFLLDGADLGPSPDDAPLRLHLMQVNPVARRMCRIMIDHEADFLSSLPTDAVNRL